MELRNKAKKSFIWSVLIQSSFQIIGFVVSIVLARILMPKDFGVIGIVGIFISLGRTLLDGGMASSLIRNKEVDQIDYSTVFFANAAASAVLYFLLFLTAPFISLFFREPNLVSILRVYGIVFLIGALSVVQSVRLNKNLEFKTQFKLLLPSLIVSAVASVWMAYNGFGVWSLVVKELLFSTIASIQIWIYSGWTPSLVFDKMRLRYHFGFGYKLVLTELLNKLFNDSYKIVVGKYFSTTQLGLFTRAKSMEELPNGVIFNSINRVMYPLLAHVNDDDQRLKNVYRRIISTVAFVVVPILTLLGLLAKPLFIFLLTNKWNEAIPYFQILILAALISPIQAYLLNICKVKGRSDLVLKLAIIEYTLIGVGLTSAYWFGLLGLLWSLVVVAFLKTVITAIVSGRLIQYSLQEQLHDIYQPYVFSLVSGLFLIAASKLSFGDQFTEIGLISSTGMIFFFFFFLMSYMAKNIVFMTGLNFTNEYFRRFF